MATFTLRRMHSLCTNAQCRSVLGGFIQRAKVSTIESVKNNEQCQLEYLSGDNNGTISCTARIQKFFFEGSTPITFSDLFEKWTPYPHLWIYIYIYILKIRYQIGSWPLLNPRNACILSDTPKVILHVSNQYTNPEIPLTPAFILWQVWGEESGESRITNLHAFWYYTLYLLITTSVMAFHYVFYMYIFIYISTY